MKVFITGASGFLGQYVVAETLRQGYEVVAMIRSKNKAEKLSWHDHKNVQLVQADLRQKANLSEVLSEVDAVIHLAAVKSGDFYDQFAGTVIATENLLAAMYELSIKRLIAISTFSVYDYLAKPTNTVLDETFPIEDDPLVRDEYAQTKLIQERLYREFEVKQKGQVTILRPGMIYGRDNLWNPCLGAEFGNTFLRVGGGKMPLTYVENCAEAVVAALAQPASIGETINIVDDNLPTKQAFSQLLFKKDVNSPKLKSINWTVAKSIADLAWFVNKVFLHGQAKMPGILIPAKMQARFKPFRYSNAKAKRILKWEPRYSLETALDRSLSMEDLLVVSRIPAEVA
jgi:nucleoside-diphosphate-sugar epimerase